MKRLGAVLLLTACGSHMRIPDAGPEDSGVDSGVPDAGRPRGEDPPAGWGLALTTPADAGMGARYGVSVSMALDQFQQPMIAALIVDPNSDGVFDDNRLVFTRWDGVAKAYQAPVTIEVVGDIDIDHPNRQVSLARSAETGQLAVAYVDSSNGLRLAWSDDEGAHWSQQTITGGSTASNPVLAMRGTEKHLAYLDGTGVSYSHNADGGSYTSRVVSPAALSWPIAMRVSSTGSLSFAFFAGDPDAGMVTLSYVHDTDAAKSIDISAVAIDKTPSVSMDMVSDVPRVAYHLTNPGAELWFSKAVDAMGSAWTTPLGLPRNGPAGMLDGTQWYEAISGNSIVANFQYRTAVGAQQCGGPKLYLDGTNGSMPCHPPESGGPLVHTFDFAGWWINMATHKTGKLTIAMDYEPRTNPLIGAGVVVYRQP
jgi:hypothetical protein